MAARIGTLVILVGLADVAFSAVLFADQLASIGSAGVWGAVMFDERAGPEAAALWFAVKGVLLVMVGLLARALQTATGTLPPAPGWILVVAGLVGAVVAPVSGFWVYLVLGALWVWVPRRDVGVEG